jgi:phosphate transport system protein
VPRERFDAELERLQEDVRSLGNDVAQAIRASVRALEDRDLEAARCIAAADAKINERRFAIESDCLLLVATQQPMAGDMRVLAAMIELVTELERTGDYAKGIARITLLIGKDRLLALPPEIGDMAERATSMLLAALDAFANRDAVAARAIPAQDDEVDALYNRAYRGLLAAIIADSSVLDHATHLLWAAHNLERAADRVTNICERTVFMVTGEMRELDSESETPGGECQAQAR